MHANHGSVHKLKRGVNNFMMHACGGSYYCDEYNKILLAPITVPLDQFLVLLTLYFDLANVITFSIECK